MPTGRQAKKDKAIPSPRPISSAVHEDLTRFFEQPTRDRLRTLLRKNVGELDNLDFKGEWPALPKMARHVLGVANWGGGCIVVGVTQQEDNSLTAGGLATLTDKADVYKGMQKFLPSSLRYEVLDFSYQHDEVALAGKRFQVVLVPDDPTHIPFVSQADGDGIHRVAIYVRRGTSSEEANHDELQNILDRRIETGFSSSGERTLQEHLAELKLLYDQLTRYHTYSKLLPMLNVLGSLYETEQNPHYPREDYEAFIGRMIRLKKRVIQKMLESEDRA